MKQLALWLLIFRGIWEICNWFTILQPQTSTQSSVLLINDHRDTINLASFRAFFDILCFCLGRIWLVVNLDPKFLKHMQKSNRYFRLFEKIKVLVWSHMWICHYILLGHFVILLVSLINHVPSKMINYYNDRSYQI